MRTLIFGLLAVFVSEKGWAATQDAKPNDLSLEWTIHEIAPGTKPALAVDSRGFPTIIYMLERSDGWVRSAKWNGSQWEIATADTGYFYGPPDVAVGPDDILHASYHDHQETRFNPGKGDAVHLFLQNGEWTKQTLEDRGHDGWDNRIAIDNEGDVHISAVDPVDFGGDGVEYYHISRDGSFRVEAIGSGPLSYEFATSIAIGPAGEPYIAYYDQTLTELRLGHRTGNGTWMIETVDNEGDSGLFSSLSIDPKGGIHISYLERTGDTSGRIKYAFRSPGSEWKITQIDSLNNVFIGFAGARNLTSLALDSGSNPWIAYSDEQALRLAVLDGSGWRTQTAATAIDNPFGQIVSLKLDKNDSPHLAFATVTSKSPLDGFVYYATAQSPRALVLRNVRIVGANLLVSFDSIQGRSYAVQFKNALSDPVWIDGESVTGNGSEVSVSISTLDSANRFYRVLTR